MYQDGSKTTTTWKINVLPPLFAETDEYIYKCTLLFVKVAEKEIARAKAEEEAQERRKQANTERKAAKKVEQKKAKMEMKKRKVVY